MAETAHPGHVQIGHGGTVGHLSDPIRKPSRHFNRPGLTVDNSPGKRRGEPVRSRRDIVRAQWQLWAVAFTIIAGLSGALILLATSGDSGPSTTFLPSRA